MSSSNAPEHMSSTSNTNASASPPRARRPNRRGKTRPPARPHERPATPLIMNTKEAAEVLRCAVEALRARCRRAAVAGPDGEVTAPLGPGITAIKFGVNTWRVRFDNAK
jgi:hypothetical protein